MGSLGEIYGKRDNEFVKGVLVGLYEAAWWEDGILYIGFETECKIPLQKAMQEAIDDLAENPGDFDVEKILECGYI